MESIRTKWLEACCTGVRVTIKSADSAVGGANQASFTVTGLTNEVAHTFELRAVSAGGNGDAGATADVWLLRLGVEGSRRFALGGDGAGLVLTPSFEVGARLDGGDAETGLGADLGGGLAFAAPEQGVALDVKARGLVAHEDTTRTRERMTGARSMEENLRTGDGAPSRGAHREGQQGDTSTGPGTQDAPDAEQAGRRDGNARALPKKRPHPRAQKRTGALGQLRIGDVIAVNVTFTESVQVTGRPTIGLGVGSNPRIARWKTGQAPGTVQRFEYTVAENEVDTDGVEVTENTLVTPTGSMVQTATGNNAVLLAHEAVAGGPGRSVDGVRPTPVRATSSPERTRERGSKLQRASPTSSTTKRR